MRYLVKTAHHSMLVHSGGTKFWEVVVLQCNDREVAIRRWGKIAFARTGGEVMVEPGMGATHAVRLVNEKQRRGYEVDPVSFNAGAWFASLSPESVGQVYEGLDVRPGNTMVFNDDFDEFGKEGLVEAKRPEPEPDRGSDWGSW